MITYDEDGFVRGFSYHDGFLEGVLTEDGRKQVHLALRAVSGERNLLTLRHVIAFHTGNFREGNIVLNLRMLSPDRASKDGEIRRSLMDRVLLDVGTLPHDSMIFLLEASFGAEVLAVCREVEVSEGGLALSRSAPG